MISQEMAVEAESEDISGRGPLSDLWVLIPSYPRHVGERSHGTWLPLMSYQPSIWPACCHGYHQMVDFPEKTAEFPGTCLVENHRGFSRDESWSPPRILLGQIAAENPWFSFLKIRIFGISSLLKIDFLLIFSGKKMYPLAMTFTVRHGKPTHF